MKKLLSIALVFVMLFAVVPFSEASISVSADVDTWDGKYTPFEYGSGTKDDPYLITTAAEFAYFAQSVNSGDSYAGKYIKLETNIKLNNEIFTFDADTGLVEVTDGTHTAYLNTGVKGDASGANTVFDSTASQIGSLYASKDPNATGTYGGSIREWIYIGSSESNCFSGTFDGGNHYISGLYHPSVPIGYYPSSVALGGGLFGYTNNAIVKNVSVVNAYIGVEYTDTDSLRVGGIICSMTDGVVENCYFDSSVIAVSSEKSTVYAGGIVGYVDSSSKITKCYNSSYILSSSNEILGGIVGCINSSSQISISACYNSGLINEGYSAGGIVGYAYLLAPSQISISDCYNSGSINAGYNAGGIVGYLYSPSSIYPKTNITNCYNVANIYASRYAGGIVGQRNYVTFSCSNCYYKIGCATFGSAIAQGVYTEDDSSTKCKAYTAGNLKKQENYVGFDFDKVWTIDPNSDYPYPTLISLPFGIDCAHIYEDTVVAPTCTEKGYTLHTCAKCSDKYEDNFVSATGHAYKDSVTAPTCTEQGYTTHTCSACGDSYTDSYVTANGHKTNDDADCTTSKVCTVCGTTVESAKGHNYVDKVTAPTCTEQGYTTHTCSACGDSYTDSYIRSNGHTAGEKANCTNNQICTTCGTTLVESLGHNYKDVVTAPTCTEQGYTTHTCSTCGDTYKDSYVTENGHKTNDAVDCNTAKVCSVCGVTVESAKGHNYVDKVTAPTCTEQGYTTHTCSACGDSYTDSYVRSNGHTAGEKADCTHDQICTTCGETLASASGHNYTEKVTAPTCTEQGYTTHTCGNCGDSYKDSYVRSNGHSAGEKADCTHDQICTSCGETLVEALGHTEGEWKIVVEATVGEKGLMEQHCAECDTVLDSKEIPALEGDIETYSLGDVNADKKVDSVDYLLVKRACFKTYALSEEETIRADVNVDKKVDSTDYLLVKRIAFGTYTVK